MHGTIRGGRPSVLDECQRQDRPIIATITQPLNEDAPVPPAREGLQAGQGGPAPYLADRVRLAVSDVMDAEALGPSVDRRTVDHRVPRLAVRPAAPRRRR